MSPTLKSTLIGLVVLWVLFSLVERWLGRAKGAWFRRGWLTDVAYFFFTPLVSKALTKAALIVPIGFLIFCGVASAADFQSRSYVGFGPLAAQPMWLQALEVYAIADFLGYWMHRLFHRGRLWPFHAVHHCSEELDWLSSVRLHPVNDLLSKFVQVAPLLLLGFNPWVTLSTAPVLTLFAILLHARVNWDFGHFRYILASPVFHRWHHSRQREAWDKNFAGLLPLWDLCFGTFYMPKGRVPEDFGVVGDFPQDLPGQLWHPIRQFFRSKTDA